MEEINTIDDLVLKLTNVKLPWDEFCPNELTNWLNVFACSHGTTKELTLLGILPTVGALLGKTELKLFSTHKKRGKMYCIALAPSGAGKTPAAQISCSRPIINHLEVRTGDDKQILVDNSSVSGLFSYFLNEKVVPVCALMNVRGFSTRCYIHPSLLMINPSQWNACVSCTMEMPGTMLKVTKAKELARNLPPCPLLATPHPRCFYREYGEEWLKTKMALPTVF